MKKQKSGLTLTFALLTCIVGANAMAADRVDMKTRTQFVRPTSYFVEERQTPGYTALTFNYPLVQKQMVAEVRQGQSQKWGSWIAQGVAKDETLYWWMLAQWHVANGKTEFAYRAAIQALVLTRLEMKSCSLNQKEHQAFEHHLLAMHQNIINWKASQEAMRTAVLLAVQRADNLIRLNKDVSNQSCYYAKSLFGDLPQDVGQWETSGGQHNQRQNLEEVKQQMAYHKILSNATIEQQWESDRLKTPIEEKR